ncbi:hypothetical protein PCE1_004986 [Barthelona sp. PCE]
MIIKFKVIWDQDRNNPRAKTTLVTTIDEELPIIEQLRQFSDKGGFLQKDFLNLAIVEVDHAQNTERVVGPQDTFSRDSYHQAPVFEIRQVEKNTGILAQDETGEALQPIMQEMTNVFKPPHGYNCFIDPQTQKQYIYPVNKTLKEIEFVYQVSLDEQNNRHYFVNLGTKRPSWFVPNITVTAVEEETDDAKEEEEVELIVDSEQKLAVAKDVVVVEPEKVFEPEETVVFENDDHTSLFSNIFSNIVGGTPVTFKPHAILQTLLRDELIETVEEQCFVERGNGEVRVLYAMRCSVMEGVKKKKSDRVLAIVRDWTGGWCIVALAATGWRLQRFSIVQTWPVVEQLLISCAANQRESKQQWTLQLDNEILLVESSKEARELFSAASYLNHLTVIDSKLNETESLVQRIRNVELALHFNPVDSTEPQSFHELTDLVDQAVNPRLTTDNRVMIIRTLQKRLINEGCWFQVFDYIINDMVDETLSRDTVYYYVSCLIGLLKWSMNLKSSEKIFASKLKLKKALAELTKNVAIADVEGGMHSDVDIDELLMLVSQLSHDFLRYFSMFPLPSRNDMNASPKPFDYNLYKINPMRQLHVAEKSSLGRGKVFLSTLWFSSDRILVTEDLELPHAEMCGRAPYENDDIDLFCVSQPAQKDPTTQLRAPTGLASHYKDAYEQLKKQLSTAELGVLYPRVVDLTPCYSCSILLIRRMHACPEILGHQWKPVSEVEHLLYEKYNGLGYTALLSSCEERWITNAIGWRHECPIFKPPRAGVYLGMVWMYMSIDGVQILVDRNGMIPMNRMKDKMLTAEELSSLQGIRFYKERNIEIESEVLPVFERVTAEFKETFGGDIGELYDEEMMCLNEKQNVWIMTYGKNLTYEEFCSFNNSDYQWCNFSLFSKTFVNLFFPRIFSAVHDRVLSLDARSSVHEQRFYTLKREFKKQPEALKQAQEETLGEIASLRRDKYSLLQSFDVINCFNRIYMWMVGDPCSLNTYNGSEPYSSITDYIPEKDQDNMAFYEVVHEAQRLAAERLAYSQLAIPNLLLDIQSQGAVSIDRIMSNIDQVRTTYIGELSAEFNVGRRTKQHIDVSEDVVIVQKDDREVYVPQLRSLSEIPDTLPQSERFEVDFSLEDLLDYVEYQPTPEDHCLAVVHEMVEIALVEACDIREILTVENVLFDCVEITCCMEDLIEDTILHIKEIESREKLENERKDFADRLYQLYSSPLMSEQLLLDIESNPELLEQLKNNPELFESLLSQYGNDEFVPSPLKTLQRVHDVADNVKTLTSTKYESGIRVLASKFGQVVQSVDSLISALDDVQDIAQVVDMMKDLSKKTKKFDKDVNRQEKEEEERYLKKLRMTHKLDVADEGLLDTGKKTKKKKKKKKQKKVTQSHINGLSPVALLADKKPNEPVPEVVSISLPEMLIENALTEKLASPKPSPKQSPLAKQSPKRSPKHSPKRSPRRTPGRATPKKRSTLRMQEDSACMKSVKGLRSLYSLYSKARGGVSSPTAKNLQSALRDDITEGSQAFSIRSEPLSPVEFEEREEQITFITDSSSYTLPLSVCGSITVSGTSVDLTGISEAAVEAVLAYLLEGELVGDVNSEAFDILAVCEMLGLTIVFFDVIDVLLNNGEVEMVDVFELIANSTVVDYTLPELLSLEEKCAARSIDMVWCKRAYSDYSNEELASVYEAHATEWPFEYANQIVTRVLSKPFDDILDDELQTCQILGERVFTLKFSHKYFVDEHIWYIAAVCPNIMSLDVSHTEVTDKSCADLCDCALLREFTCRDTRISQEGVNKLVAGIPGILVDV